MDDFAIKISDGKASIFTPYNKIFVDRIKLLGGRWDSANRCWSVKEHSVDDVRETMRQVYGRDDQPAAETVDVELTFTGEYSESHAPVTLFGRTIASATGRDSGARIGSDVLFLAGAPESGGSAKYWHTAIPEGCVVKLPRVPKSLVDAADIPSYITVRILGTDIDRDALEAEKAKLLARIAEIDKILEATI